MIAAVKWSRSNARSGSFSIQNRLLKRYSVKHLQLRSNWSSASRIAILASLVFLSGIGSDFRNTLVALERFDFWQLDLVRRLDSFQFHDGHGARQRLRCLITRSTVAAATAICFSGTRNSVLGLHHRFRPPPARGMAAPTFSNALELSNRSFSDYVLFSHF